MPASGYDGSIKIDSRIDGKGFNAGIKSMIGSLTRLAAVAGVAFGVGVVILFGKTATEMATQLANAMTGLQSVLDGQGRSFANAQKFIDDYTSDGLIPATNALKAYQNLALRGYSDEQIARTLTALKDSAAFGRRASLSMGDAVQTATEGLRNENSILVDNAGVTKNVAKMWEEYAKSIGTTANNLTQAQKIQAEVNGILEETKFQTGDAAKISGSYAGQVAALGTSFYNFKVAVGNTIIPVLTVIIPYIKAVIDWLVVLFNTFARVIGLFFNVETSAADAAGSVAANTEQAADAAGDLADNTKAAGKAAKGALAAFDELNVLQKPDAAGGGDVPGAGGIPIGDVTVGDPKNLIPDALMDKVQEFKERLIQLFEPASKAFGEFKDALRELGGTIWDGLKWAWDNILVPLGEWAITDVLPVFFEILAEAATILDEALIALKPLGLWLWEEFLQPVAQWTGGAIVDILTWLRDRLKDIGDWIRENPKAFETIVIILGSLALAWWLVNAAVAAWTVISGIAAGVTTAFGVAMAFLTSPIFLIALAIGILIAIIILLIKNWDWVKETAGQVWDWIVDKWMEAGPWFKANVTEPVVKWFQDAWENIKTWAGDAWEGIKDIWGAIGTWIQDNVTDPVKNAFKTVLDWIGEKWESVFGGIRDFVKGIINKIIDFINGMVQAIGKGVNAVINALNGININIPTWIPVYGGQSWGLNLSNVDVPQIPRLATGAVIPPNAEFLAMLGDQRSGRNIEAPESLLRQIVQEELGKIEADIRIEFGGTLGALIRELKPMIDKENVRVGRSLVTGGVQ